MRAYPHAKSVHAFGEKVHYTDQRADFSHEGLSTYLTEQGHNGYQIEQIKPNIEDCFMALM